MLSKSEYEQLAELRYKIRLFLRFSEQAVRAVGITPNQHQLLLSIQGYPGRDYATPTELAQRLQLKHNSCLGLISRCEHLGLLVRFDNPEDGRSLYVRLSERGRQMLEELAAPHKIELERLGLNNRQS